MKYDINKTELVPYIIAERAVWSVLETDKRHKDKTSAELSQLADTLIAPLVDKAEQCFDKSEHFRKSILNKRTDSRYILEMFMEHWCEALLNPIKKQIPKTV
jgi:hypothetical protein